MFDLFLEKSLFLYDHYHFFDQKHDGLRLIRQGRFDRRAFVRIIRCADDRMRVVSNDC